jgi:hypothetical protein
LHPVLHPAVVFALEHDAYHQRPSVSVCWYRMAVHLWTEQIVHELNCRLKRWLEGWIVHADHHTTSAAAKPQPITKHSK